MLAGLVGLDIHEPHSRVALQTGSIQQRIDPPRIQRGVPQLTLPQHFSPPLLGLDGAMKPLVYSGETFRNYQQEIVERFSMEMAERHHAVNKVNRCGRRYGRCGGLRNRPAGARRRGTRYDGGRGSFRGRGTGLTVPTALGLSGRLSRPVPPWVLYAELVVDFLDCPVALL